MVSGVSGEDACPALAYARRLYENIGDWYKSADQKAQVILGLDGTFLAFVSSSAFQKTDDLRKTVESLSAVTLVLLAAMVICIVLSMTAAVASIWSRLEFPSKLSSRLEAASQRAPSPDLYPPDVMWFFQYVSELDRERFAATLEQVSPAYELQVLAFQSQALGANVKRKHFAVDLGLVLAVAALVFFAAAAAVHLASMRT